MSSTGLSSVVEIVANAHGVVFTPDCERLVSGGDAVCVWRVQDGKQVAMMETGRGSADCLAVSQDGKFIAAATYLGDVFVWDAKTYKRVFAEKEGVYTIRAVDFSPNSSHLAASPHCYTIIWDITTQKQVVRLEHDDAVVATKYSPKGDRIATATKKFVQVWDSRHGKLLVNVPANVIPGYNTGLCWLDNHLLVISDKTIQRFDASTGSAVAEWTIPDANFSSCVALLRQGQIIAYRSSDTIVFWDSLSHTQLFLTQQHRDIRSISFSPDDQLLAIVHSRASVDIARLSDTIIDSLLSLSRPALRDPDFHIDDAILGLWKDDQLARAETLLTTAITNSCGTVHRALATRALVRTRLGQGDTAIADAEKSIEIQPSLIGYIAKFLALAVKGKMLEAFRVCDIALQHFHTTHTTTLLLIKAVVLFMVEEHDDAISRMDDLIRTVPLDSRFYLVKTYMYLHLGNRYLDRGNHDHALEFLRFAETQLRYPKIQQPPLMVSLISGWKFDNLKIAVRQRLCEAFYAAGRINEANNAITETVNIFREENLPVTGWVTDFMQRCLSTTKPNDNTSHRSTSLLVAWAQLKIPDAALQDIMATTVDFVHPRQAICQVVCEHLEIIDRIPDAVACFHHMIHEFPGETEDAMGWITDFKSRCDLKLKALGQTVMTARKYDEAISLFTAALSLAPAAPQDLLIKRGRAYVGNSLWDDALNDANEVIKLDPSSPFGYELKHAALRGAGLHDDAIAAFESMLSTMLQSSDPEVRDRSGRYITPAEAKKTICAVVARAIQDSPPELINTKSGRLLNKTAQALSFESEPIFVELISSTTTEIDHARIEHEVAQYFQYATFSHRWEVNEPLFDSVVNVMVYDLEGMPTHKKLQMFCKVVCEAGFNWAWSDTCCINKGDHFVLQEALVSMFRWYQGSAMTIVFLLGVNRLSQWGDLTRSIWNTRAWTLQEYHASKVVRFYTEDWSPYMNLDIPNHKDSPQIIAEMERATGVSAQTLVNLRPGLGDVREKLRLASTRETTRIEDVAYSLLGIFDVSLPITYGEGNKALGRLLAQLLMSSGDTTILAWTGKSGGFNSCLPANIIVFGEPSTSHIPASTARNEIDATAVGLRTSPPNVRLAIELYDRLGDLPVPSFLGQRMRLPCFHFKLGPVLGFRHGTEQVFRAQTTALGVVEIKTDEDLTRLGSLCLVHPWIDFLLDRQPVGDIAEVIPEESTNDESSVPEELPTPFGQPGTVPRVVQPRATQLMARFGRQFGVRRGAPGRDATSLQPPSTVSPMEKQTRALDFVSRLRRPFGALLLAPLRRNAEEYRRVAPEALITVQVQETTPEILKKLIESVRVLDVL